MPHDHHFTIAGLRWLWRYTRLKGQANGWTVYADAKKKTAPKILIYDGLKGRARLEIELHEALHACFPQIDEDVITQAGRDVSRILWTLGYRIDEQKAPEPC